MYKMIWSWDYYLIQMGPDRKRLHHAYEKFYQKNGEVHYETVSKLRGDHSYLFISSICLNIIIGLHIGNRQCHPGDIIQIHDIDVLNDKDLRGYLYGRVEMVFQHTYKDARYTWLKITTLPIAADYLKISTDRYIQVEKSANQKVKFIPYNRAGCKVTPYVFKCDTVIC